MCYSSSRKISRQYILRVPLSQINLWMPQYFAKVSPQELSCAAWHRLWRRFATFSVSTDTKKNPNGRVRYPIKRNWNSASGKTLSGTCRITPVSQDHVQGRDLEVGFCGLPLEQLTSTWSVRWTSPNYRYPCTIYDYLSRDDWWLEEVIW